MCVCVCEREREKTLHSLLNKHVILRPSCLLSGMMLQNKLEKGKNDIKMLFFCAKWNPVLLKPDICSVRWDRPGDVVFHARNQICKQASCFSFLTCPLVTLYAIYYFILVILFCVHVFPRYIDF